MSSDGEKPAIILPELECGRCHYKWYPSVAIVRKGALPKFCPNCKSMYWNRPRVRHRPKEE